MGSAGLGCLGLNWTGSDLQLQFKLESIAIALREILGREHVEHRLLHVQRSPGSVGVREREIVDLVQFDQQLLDLRDAGFWKEGRTGVG